MKNVFPAIILFAALLGCRNQGDYSEHASGLEYKFIETNTSGQSPSIGDIVVLSLRYETTDGQVIDEAPLYKMQVNVPGYQGDFYTGLQMLQVGDSVCFKLDAADFFERTRKTDLPKGIQQGDQLLIYLRLKNIIDAATLEKERRSMYHTDESQELSLLDEYLEKANIQVKPTASGLYRIVQDEGTGAPAEPGMKLTVHYTGKGIDGRIFDTSLTRGKPYEFTLGRGEVIPGWDEGLVGLKKGARVRLIIPSSLAYGRDGWGEDILPFSTLIFEIEIIDIK